MRRSIRNSGIVCLLIALVGCSTSKVFVKDGIQFTNFEADLKECHKNAAESSKYYSSPSPGYYGGSGGLIGAIAGGIAVGIASGIARANKETELAHTCMENLGYTHTPLNSKDVEAYNDLKEPEQRTEFLQRVNAEIKAGRYVFDKKPDTSDGETN